MEEALAVEVAEQYPVALHSVGLNLGGSHPINFDYCRRIGALADKTRAFLVSDHLAFTSVGNRFHHDLWPMPRSAESVRHLVDRINAVQDVLSRRLHVENISTYVRHETDSMDEGTFLAELVEATGCGLILDLNNLDINAFNHGESAQDVIRAVDSTDIGYVHIAGGEQRSDVIVDTHSTAPNQRVLDLLDELRSLRSDVPVLLEWDAELPSYDVLMNALDTARPIDQAAA